MAEHDPASLQDTELERAVLGACFLDAEALAIAEAILSNKDFAAPAHATIFAAMQAVARRGVPVDVLLLGQELKARGALQTVGGAPYLGDLTDAVTTTAHVEAHATLVADLAAKRRYREACRRALQALDQGIDPAKVQRDLAAAELAAHGAHRARRVGETLHEVLEVFHARAEGQRTPVATPWPQVTAALGGGLLPGVHFLIGGTGSGKTQWALQVALQTATAGRPVVYVGLELGPEDLTARLLGLQTAEPWSTLFRGSSREALARATTRGEKVLRELPLWLEFAPPYGWQADRMLTLARAHRPALLVLDFIQVVAPLDAREDPRARVGRVAYLARAVGRDLGVAVLVLSSTARGNYDGLEKSISEVRPGELVGAGKESGEVEYSADTVMVLGRDTATENNTRAMWVAVAKQRAGSPAVLPLFFDGHRFDGPPEAVPVDLSGAGKPR
jgi:replicative DNA helicase